MRRCSISKLAALVAVVPAVVLLVGPASAFTDTVISDGTFTPASWTHSILWSRPTANLGPMTQELSGGNPGFYQRGQHQTVGSFAAIYDGHLYTGGPSYDPSTQGAIASLDVQYDYIDLPGPGGGTQNGLLVSQGGHTYIRYVDSSFWSSWHTHALAGITQGDTVWEEVSASGTSSGHPDFSAAGGPMRFGYYTFNWSLPQGFDIQRIWGVDDFQVTVHGNAATSLCFGDGTGAACPCGNSGQSGRGCENSSSTGGAQLTAAGTTNPDTIVLSAAGEKPTALTIFLQGTTSSPAIVFGDGLRCVTGVLKRLYSRNASGGAVSAPQGAEPSITARSQQLGDPVAPGSTRHYMTYYRDADPTFCPAPNGSTFNGSNALSIAW